MSGLDSRWIAVCGDGSLLVSSNLKLKDSEIFPADYKNVADSMAMTLDFLLSEGNSNWSYFSPSAKFDVLEQNKYNKKRFTAIRG